ncbi:MAG: ATP-binding cassette domain-containing protein [Planctomycetota bacterium]
MDAAQGDLSSRKTLLSVESLALTFHGRSGDVRALDDVSLEIAPGESLGLVGESGSGKSTLLRVILGLYAPDRGVVKMRGEVISGLSPRQRRPWSRHLQVVFQDPYASLNPRMRVVDIVGEPLREFDPSLARAARRNRTGELLAEVGLTADALDRYPHEFSGGQRQRIGIARALALEPDLLLLDEAVSALDVSVQAQILNLLADLKAEKGLSYLFVSHDLAVVRAIADRIAVMHRGQLVEIGLRDEILRTPQHPYTQRLREAIPVHDPKLQRARLRRLLESDPHAL